MAKSLMSETELREAIIFQRKMEKLEALGEEMPQDPATGAGALTLTHRPPYHPIIPSPITHHPPPITHHP